LAFLLSRLLRILQRKTDAPAETIRKLFHLGGGAVALALPWLFDAVWPVVMLFVASMVIFVALRVVPVLREGPGQVLHAVPRKSVGEFWFMLGVMAIYAIAGDDVVVYSIGILILAVADMAAALVGLFYGQHSFAVSGGTKSAEGSSAFLLTAFLCVHVPILLFTDVGRLESLLIAINVGLLLMFAEAGASRGSDNFMLPVLVVVLLDAFLKMQATEIAIHFSVIVALGLLAFFYRNRTTLSADALIIATLVAYIFWLFGDWRWLVAPLILFATYTWLLGRPRLTGSREFHADVFLAIAAPGLTLVTAYEVLELEALYLPYVAVWSANLAIIGTLHRQLEAPDLAWPRFAVSNTLKSLVVMIPGMLVGGHAQSWSLAATFLSVPAALWLFALVGRSLKFEPTRPAAWVNVAVAVGAGTLLSFGLLGAIHETLGMLG
jgi:phytol kinase